MTCTASHLVDSRRTTHRFPRRIAALTVVALVAACGQPDRVVELPMPSVPTGEAVMHAVRNEQLRDVMRGMRDPALDRLPQELDDPSRERAYLQDLSSHARDLAQDADRIGAIADRTGLTTDQQQVFLGLAGRLRNRALQLREQADLRQTRLIDATLKEIDDTCVACHALFRDLPEPLPAAKP